MASAPVNNMDLLDLLGGIGDPSPVLTSSDSAVTGNGGLNNILGGFGGGLDATVNPSINGAGGAGLLDSSLFGGVPSSGLGLMNSNNNIGGLGGSSTLMGGLLDDLTSTSGFGGADLATEPEGEVCNIWV